jgi:sugar phosphate isomerase/epimerase
MGGSRANTRRQNCQHKKMRMQNFGVSMSLCRGDIRKYMQAGDLAQIYLSALRDFVDFARENDFEAIELATVPAIHAGVLAGIVGDIRKGIAGFKKVTCHLPLGEINISALHPGIRREAIEEMKRSIDVFAEAGIGEVIMHPGCFAAMPDFYLLIENEVRALAETSVSEIHDHCKRNGVRLSIENLPRHEPLFQKPHEFEALARNGLGLVLDTVHAFQSGVDPVDFIETFGNGITEVHLTDGVKSDPVAHWAIGRGEVDCLAVLDELRRMRFAGTIVLEMESKEDLIRSKEFLIQRGYL